MSPFDSGFSTKISPQIEGQVPDYIQSDHKNFVEFLKSYYEFLEAAELTVSGVINNIIQETTSTNFILNEDGNKVVGETGLGTTGKFVVGETITGGTSKATATILVDMLSESPSRMFISCNQKFIVGETLTGETSGATATVVDYRPNPVNSIQKLLDFANTDNTTAKLLDEMQAQFMAVLPNTLASGLSKRDLMKNIKDLYTAKGTSEGHKLFLRLMFDEDVDVFYPTKYMMRLSDGNWTKKSIIRCRNFVGANGDEVIGQTLTGATSGATVFVSNATGFAQGADSITEFEIDLDSVVGTFVDGETLSANGINTDVEQKFTIQKMVTGATINDGGILYSTGDKLTLDSSIGNGAATAQVNSVSFGSVSEIKVNAGGSNYQVGEILTFSPTSAQGFISVVGGSFLLEDTDASDGAADYIQFESGTNFSFPEMSILSESGADTIVLDGTDSSSTNAGWKIIYECATPRLIVVDDVAGGNIIEEEGTNSTYGEITKVTLTDGGTGYSALPTVSVTSKFGTSAKLLASTNDIGSILDVAILDNGFNYKGSPNATVPTNFILNNISGTFSATNTLSSHTGTVTSYDSDTQQLKVDIEDVVRMRMEQENTTVNANIQQEENTELTFSRLLGDNVLEANTLENLTDRGIDIEDSTGVTVVSPANITNSLTDFSLVTDADGSRFHQITLEKNSDYLCTDSAFSLEDQNIGGDVDNIIRDRTTNNFEQRIISTTHMMIIFDGTALGGSILIEDGGTDGSGTNAGDEIIMDASAASTDVGDKILQQSDDEGNDILVEPEASVSNIQQRKDKFQLDGSKEQLHTEGGWLDSDRASSTTASQLVFVPATEGDDIKLENEDGHLLLDGTSSNSLFRVTSNRTTWQKTLDNGDNIKTEGTAAYIDFVPHEVHRVLDETDGILLEDGSADATYNTKEFLILEGIDGNSGGTDANGYYNIFENKTINHGDDSNDRIVSESGEGISNEDSNDPEQNTLSSVVENSKGIGGKVVLDHHIINNQDETILIVMNGTNSSGANAGDSIIFDGLSATDRIGNSIMQESGLSAGESDTDVGSNLIIEDEDFLTGNVLLDRTDDDDTDLGDNIVHETGEDFTGQTITTTAGASATIVGGKSADVTMTTGFISTAVGEYQNTDSLISEDVIRIQDSYYYQDFSYEVRIGQSVANYMNELKRAVHPTGFAAFGKVSFATLVSAALPAAGAGRIDAPSATFTPELASTLEGIFDLKINQRLDFPRVYEEGSVFQEIRLEDGLSEGDIVLDGTNFGIGIETDSSGTTDLGVLMLESSKDDGDNIIIVGSDDGSQTDAGDQIILEGTNAAGANNVDVTGETSYLILDATSVTSGTGEINDAGSNILYNGSALGEYNLIDASSNTLVLDGTASGTHNRIVAEDGDDAGDNIVTDNFAYWDEEQETGGPLTIESSDIENQRGPYLYTENNFRLITENFVVTRVDGPLSGVQANLVTEVSIGGNVILNGTDINQTNKNSRIMSEAAAGISDPDRDNLFVRQLKVKITVPQPRPLNSVGLSHMVLDTFGESSGITNVQLEDALRKRGPTINVDRLVLDGVDTGEKDDSADLKFAGEPLQMEEELAINLGTALKFKDFYKITNYWIILNGTDSDGTNSGDNIELETNWGGRLVSEDQDLAFPMNDFLRPDLMVMEGDYYKHSEWGRIALDGSASDGSTGTIDGTGYDYLVLDGIDAMQSGAGDNLLLQEQNDINKSIDDANDIFIRVEDYEGGSILLNGTDSSSTNAGDDLIDESSNTLKQEDYGQVSGELMLENDWRVYLLLERSDATGTDDGTVIGLEEGTGTGSLLNEMFDGYGHGMILEEGSTSTKNSKLLLDSQLIEIESGINDGEIPTANWGENSQFPAFTNPTEISTRPIGRVSLQDERAITEMVLDGTDGSASNAGDNIIFDRTNADGDDIGDKLMAELGAEVILDQSAGGQLLLNGTDGSSTNAGGYIDFEDGTYSSLLGIAPAFLPIGFDAESFDNTTRTTFDSTTQTYDVLEGF